MKGAQAVEKDKGQITERIVEQLKEYLADVPSCSLEPRDQQAGAAPEGADWIGRLQIGQYERSVLIATKPSGQPRLARETVNQLLRWRTQLPDTYCIFGAPYISDVAGKIATEAGVGYVDLAGNCRLCFGSMYIRRAGWPNLAVERRRLRSMYSPKAERILRVLAAQPKRAWKIEPLAAEARVSLGMASKVKRLLEDREWLARGPGGFSLSEPAKLLAEWAANYDYERNTVQDFFSLDPIPQIESKLVDVCQDSCKYALTGFSAAARMAPMVRYQRATAYVIGSLDEVAGRMGLRRVTSGANVSLIKPYDEGVLWGSKEVDGAIVVFALQAYLDLLNFRGRGEEAAEAVLDQVIKPTW